MSSFQREEFLSQDFNLWLARKVNTGQGINRFEREILGIHVYMPKYTTTHTRARMHDCK